MADAKTDRSFYRNYYREIDVLHGLQSAPEERDWLLTTPKGDVKQSDIVLYLGCNVMRTTHLVRTVMDVFKLLDVDFTTLCFSHFPPIKENARAILAEFLQDARA